MINSAAAQVVSETKALALPAFIVTIVIFTGALLWGMRVLQKVLLSPDPDNRKLRFLDRALSEERLSRVTDPAPQGKLNLGGPPPNPSPSQTAQDVPSTSRIGGAIGNLVLAAMALGVGYYTISSLFTYQTVDLSSIGTYFFSGSTLFALDGFNQLSSIFKVGG